jgi:hypothetical protein
MAFILKNLSPVGATASKGPVPGIWSYKTDDAHATVDTAGYFNNASTLLGIGDILWVVVVTNLGAPNEAVATYGHHIVLSNAAGVVDVSDVTVGTVTDSD